MWWVIFGVLLVGTGVFYALGFGLRLIDSPWLAARMAAFFPLLAAKVPAKGAQLVQLASWAVLLPVVGLGIFRQEPVWLAIVAALSAWEVYLGATFYFEIGDVKQACVHMILHAFIVGVILSYFSRSAW